jgi:hypothetical protein
MGLIFVRVDGGFDVGFVGEGPEDVLTDHLEGVLEDGVGVQLGVTLLQVVYQLD